MKRKWFKAKRYGWGWYPATWEGWLVLGVYIFYVIIRLVYSGVLAGDDMRVLTDFILEMISVLVLLIIVCIVTGEAPGWRWGKKNKT